MAKVDERYQSHWTPSTKMEFIIDKLEEITEMLDDVNYEICRDGVKANADW